MSLLLRGTRTTGFCQASTLARRLCTATTQVSEIKSDAEYNSVIESLAETGKLGVFDFTAKWCGPCRMVAPLLDDISMKHPEVSFYKVDIDNPDCFKAVTEAEISAVPTFVFMKGASRVDMFAGARMDLLQTLLDKHKDVKQ